MDYRDLEYATRAVVDLTNPLRDVELDTVARAADVAASVAEATRSVEATPNISDLASNLNGLATKSADLVARPLPVIQQPAWFDAASAFMGAWQPPLGALDGLVDGYQWARDGLSAATAAVGSVAQAADFLAQPMESAFMSTVTPVAGMMGSFTAAARVATDWKPALMQFSPPLEASFATRLSEIERTIYSAIRPEILSVADQLGWAFELPPQNTFVDYMGTLFELDFDLDPELDLDAPPTDDLPGMALRRPRWLDSRRLVVWLADRPVVVEVTGLMLGEAAGVGADMLLDGAVGTLIGNVGGAGLGFALGKVLVVVVKRCRARS